MLWCKDTFERHFERNECRLFPVQQQLFDFVDDAAAKQGENTWLCFCIEFPSVSEVSRLLSRHTASDRARALFQSKQIAAAAQGGAVELRKRPREDFALLYGETPLSQQSRMFLAATLTGLRSVLATIDARQLHLYEIIREGSPCHLYFDVERDGDYVALRTAICVDDDSNSSSVVAGDDSFVCVEEAADGKRHTSFQCSVLRYQQLWHRAAGAPPDVCGLNCAVEPDNAHTCDVLLRELEAFVRDRFPSLIDPQEDEGESCAFEEVWVLESVPLFGVATKFSQHYVIKFKNTVFDSTNSVKLFVRQLVAYLSDRATRESSIHRSLFFHGSPAWYAVFHELAPDYPRNTLPYLPRKCVVDEAVYSKNRMMRCLGSCKLGKSSVLRVHRHYLRARRQHLMPDSESAPPSLDVFLATMISHRPSSGTAIRAFHVDGQSDDCRGGGGRNAWPSCAGAAKTVDASRWEATRPAEDETLSRLSILLQRAYTKIAHCECAVLRPRRLHDRFLTFQVHGTRYCQHVGREHKSNNVYLVVDLAKRTFVQKCFDPDCVSYRSPPFLLDTALPPET
ncbi:putative mitochondrial hypothetical protein [Leptomonas pyrrhocoris]|uniref:DNA-directed primase/polymerase protein n=1 Tax=Leptomonas pyrrhocoris TaxID=157538 RepID=A0A0M9FVJ6_LEPPY|nr:putative mitochondrial hypothetical protein [Leptomonas pyrrhocoris]KPA76873.1 putative mitochondrial hypothetical protein [Leptomonas pyrrhocoris]|eukprot:XP_015655312.1 putative mitochondrial hypothetical protein [Leptomonas pyrrhocoris]